MFVEIGLRHVPSCKPNACDCTEAQRRHADWRALRTLADHADRYLPATVHDMPALARSIAALRDMHASVAIMAGSQYGPVTAINCLICGMENL